MRSQTIVMMDARGSIVLANDVGQPCPRSGRDVRSQSVGENGVASTQWILPPPRFRNVPVLYLDLDGVLHPEDVWRAPGRPPFVRSPVGHELFEHAGLLVELLAAYPAVRIVLSTSWVRVLGYRRAIAFLLPTIRARCIGATWHRRMSPNQFEHTPRGEQVLNDVARRTPKAWLAIDDDQEGWGSAAVTHLVATDPILGIAEPAVLGRLRAALERFE
jgi:hypothetical protein